MIVDRGPKQARVALDVAERWARGEIALEEVWDAKGPTKEYAYRGNAIAALATRLLEAAGDNTVGFDDEALQSAAEAVTAVLETLGEAARPAIVEHFRATIPPPTRTALDEAHATRNPP